MLALLIAAPAFAQEDPDPEPEVVASWSFAGDLIYADGGSDENLGEPLAIYPERNITFVSGPSGARAANATSWHNGESYWHVTVSTEWFENITVSSRQSGSGTGPRDFVVEYRPDSESSWEEIAVLELNTSWTLGTLDNVILPASANNSPAIELRWRKASEVSINDGDISGGGTSRIAQIYVRGVEMPPDPNDPAITVVGPPLAPFETVLGSPSDVQAYAVTGVNLTDPIAVTAPPGFQVSADGTTFDASVQLNPDAGEVDATVYARLTGDEVGAYAGVIRHESPGARARIMAASGTVLADWPPEDAVIQITAPGTYEVPSHGVTLTFHTVPPAGGSVTVAGLDTAPEPAPPGSPANRFLQLTSDMPNYSFDVSVLVDVSEWEGLGSGTRVAYLNDDFGKWTFISGTYSSSAQTVTFDTRHFTTFTFTTLPSTPFDLFVSDDPSVAATAAVFPNASWADTGYDPNDWSLANAEVALYLVPAEGAIFQSIDVMVTWDADVLELVDAGAGDGLFSDGGAAVIYHDPLGAPGQLSINAARLANENFVIDDLASGNQYIAELVFTLANPGSGHLDLSMIDVRTTDGIGGQGMAYAIAHGGAVRAFLGDVGSSGDESTGDGAVDFDDLVLFAAAYWAGVPGGPDPEGDTYMVKYDVGPTQDGSVFSMPEVDGQIQFEDLVIFSLSYGLSAIGAYPRPALGGEELVADAASGDGGLTIHTLPARLHAGELRIPIAVSGASDLRAVSLQFDFDGAGFEVIGAAAAEQGVVDPAELFTAAFGTAASGVADAARLGGEGVVGAGELLEVRLRPLHGDAAALDGVEDLITLRAAVARNSANEDQPVVLANPAGGASAPAAFRLEGAFPNPVSGSATIAFELPERSHVSLAVYDLLGRRAALVIDGEYPAGRHAVSVDTRSLASGAYVYRIEAGAFVETRRLTVIR